MSPFKVKTFPKYVEVEGFYRVVPRPHENAYFICLWPCMRMLSSCVLRSPLLDFSLPRYSIAVQLQPTEDENGARAK
ncbi:hypothetical protein PHAVU_008G202400 [Phaseolus vulgaris]|uniref:Uncharacterized protein n=1 Tax=Phaseolus vulgaris TaxID=3885 RepID=V7B6G9_PHAVU|nr:hypothetical protein PHAVU_008G202400g [Phaseolus vulgaris]ESW13507.1 hypothetical protein PHAVU_008G202400g [Phaseolus vulgaris]